MKPINRLHTLLLIAFAVVVLINGCFYKVPEKSVKVAQSLNIHWFPDHSEITKETLKH